MNRASQFSEKEREYPHCHLIQFLCFIGFFIVWILDSFVINYSIGLSSLVPLFLRLIVFGILVCLAFVISRSLHNLILNDEHIKDQKGHRHYPPDQVVDYGAMAYVRHPLYLAVLLFYFAFVVLTMSIISFLVWIIIFFIHNIMASFEEKQLITMFNDDYKEYRNRVPKWFPNPLKIVRLN
jgi:protein-S-isoprenylcysteine O-methyltransferase Ste14